MDTQSGVRLKGKQVIQIPFQAQIRASQLLVRVVRFARFFVDRPLVEKALIRLKPGLQGVLKAHLVGSASALVPGATTPCQRPFSGCASGNG